MISDQNFTRISISVALEPPFWRADPSFYPSEPSQAFHNLKTSLVRAFFKSEPLLTVYSSILVSIVKFARSFQLRRHFQANAVKSSYQSSNIKGPHVEDYTQFLLRLK